MDIEIEHLYFGYWKQGGMDLLKVPGWIMYTAIFMALFSALLDSNSFHRAFWMIDRQMGIYVTNLY